MRKDLGRGEARIEPDPELGTRKRAPKFRQQPMEQADRAGPPRDIAGAEDRRDEVLPRLVVKRQGAHERQIAPVIVGAIEEGQLPGAVGLVLGGIEIDRDQPDAAAAAAMPSNHRVGERVTHGEQHPRSRRVLETRDGRLRRQAAAVNRVASRQQFVDRIVGEPVAVIPVGMAACDREDPLGDQIPNTVRDASRIPRIGDGRRQRRQQTEVSVSRLEQNRPTVRARVWLIKRRNQEPIGQVGKQNSLCYRRFVHAIASVWGNAV
jgi:hypothetical protein